MSAFNAEKYLPLALDSILSQTFKDFELFISDDGSSDRTREIIDSYRDVRIKRYHQDSNLGKTTAINQLFTRCTGELITIHDADDISLPDRLEKQWSAFKNNSEIGLCGTAYMYIYEDGQPFNEVHYETSHEEIRRKIFKQTQFHGPTILFKKNLIKQDEPLYRPFFDNYNEDCDLAIRLVQRTRSMNLDEVLYKYRILPNSYSKDLTARKKVMYYILSRMARQREEGLKDFLEKGEFDKLEELVARREKPYRLDASLIHRERAAFQMYFELFGPAIRSSWVAVRNNPFSQINYRTMHYCIRKALKHQLIKEKR